MKRILACLATLTLTAAAPAAVAGPAHTHDAIGVIIAALSPQPASNDAWNLKATLYHGGGAMSTHDSIGCRVSPMRTVAIDRNLITRGAILFIKETVGLLLPDGGRHDGYWYASDTGGLIRGPRIDLFTGPNQASMNTLLPLNLKTLTVTKVGEFKGCPPVDGSETLTRIAKAAGVSGRHGRARGEVDAAGAAGAAARGVRDPGGRRGRLAGAEAVAGAQLGRLPPAG